jgi:uncharacterized RDD family membrane protein YckC
MITYSFINKNPQIAEMLSLIIIIMGLLALLYFAIMDYKFNQTIGKMFMNIKIESTKKELSFLDCIIRHMFLIMIFPFTLLWILDPLFLIFNKQGRRLSEILSKTKTVEVYNLR